MGVYIFKSKTEPFLKVGHHKITDKRPTVYHRTVYRGFHTCKHPDNLIGKLNWDDFTLVAWFPTLTTKHEMAVHQMCWMKEQSTRKCEFHELGQLESILSQCRKHGNEVYVPENTLQHVLTEMDFKLNKKRITDTKSSFITK